jgi:hypothetical protein
MYRRQAPTEFGFATSSYVPPEHPRPLWRTLLIGALLALIPAVGAGISAIYIDRRQIPGSFDFTEALKTALIQILALLVVALIVALILTASGFSWQLVPQFGRTGG